MPHWQPGRYRRCLSQDLRDRVALLAPHRHEDARHQREMKGHVALVAADGRIAEVFDHVGGPLVRLGEQHAVRVEPVHFGPDAAQVLVGFLEVLAVRALPLVQVRHGIQPEPVDAEVEPEPQHFDHGILHARVVVIQIRLVGEEPVPVVLAAYLVVGPVGMLGVHEDDPCVPVALVSIRPHVEIAVGAVRVTARCLEPWVVFAGMVHYQVGDNPDAAIVRSLDQLDKIPDSTKVWQYRREISDVVSAVAERRCIDGQQPEAVDPQPLQVVEPGDETADVPGAIAV